MKIETETIPINSYKFRVNMELEARELVTLITILNQIGGSPHGPREFTNKLLVKLRAIVPEYIKSDMGLAKNILSNDELLLDEKECSITLANEWPDNCKGH